MLFFFLELARIGSGVCSVAVRGAVRLGLTGRVRRRGDGRGRIARRGLVYLPHQVQEDLFDVDAILGRGLHERAVELFGQRLAFVFAHNSFVLFEQKKIITKLIPKYSKNTNSKIRSGRPENFKKIETILYFSIS